MLKVKKQQIGGVLRHPFENFLQLTCMVQYNNLRGRSAGAALLKKNQDYQFSFGFECSGIHPTLEEEQLRILFNGIEAGLKDLPPLEKMTIHLSSFASCKERIQDLETLWESAPSSTLRLLIKSEQKRVQELYQQGVRKPKTLYIFVTYTVVSESDRAQGWVDQSLAWVFKQYQNIAGDPEIRNTQIELLLEKGFVDGFMAWEQLLSTKMGLELRPLQSTEIWDYLWGRFNTSQPIPVPQCIVLDETGIHDEINTRVHPLTLLQEETPVADAQWIRVRNNFVGVLTFLEKPGGWSSRSQQLRYLWEMIARARVSDTEVVCQLGRANEGLVKTSVQRLIRQSNNAATFAASKNSIDVGAQLKADKAVDAQIQILEGSIPIWVAVAILVHRPTLEKLDEACRYIQNCFTRPAWVQRETFYAWDLWLQTLPICWNALLARPFKRRQLYLNTEVMGMMPLVKPREVDLDGLELITEEGGTPIYLDLSLDEGKHVGIFSTTRGGKSVLVSGILTRCLASGIPVRALDFPKPDGTSTFTDYTKVLEGAYFDIGIEANNLFEVPDLRALPEAKQKERMEEFIAFLENALLAMVMGKNRDAAQSTKVRSILSLALQSFFDSELNKSRYRNAIEAGVGTDAWQKMPTLREFLPFCTPDALGMTITDSLVRSAFEVIDLRLRFWLNSRVGRAISCPSTFRTDASLLVFALRNVDNEEDAAVLALAALTSTLRCALQHPKSIFFIDEAPILFRFEEIAELVGRLCANGAKAGIRVIIAAQDPNTIGDSVAGPKILQNLTTKLVGRVQRSAVAAFEKYLHYPRELIRRNAGDKFFPEKSGLYSKWLLEHNGIFTYCRYYPGEIQLATVANNTDEQLLRDSYFAQHVDRELALVSFSRHLVQKIRAS